ncbi:MAG: hypothetical protein H6733_03445 [Alphaproteobacteria bacterium]|nr:hypothetical protein [Alphaproteobacteria bacterium]
MTDDRPASADVHGEALVDAFVAFFETFGVKPTVGRVWATLYLSPVPLGQDELRALTGLSMGMVSQALSELDGLDAVTVVRVPGSRRLHYEPQPHLLRSLRRLLVRRDLAAIRALREVVRRAAPVYRPPVSRDVIAARFAALEQVADLYEAVFAVLEGVARMPSLVPGALAALRRTQRLSPSDGR